MEEVYEGIFRYGGELETSEKPLVLVHPWYADRCDKKVSFGREGNGYLKNLSNFLRKMDNRNILLFEEESFFRDEYKKAVENIERISDIRKSDSGLYFLLTEQRNPFPKDADWSDIVYFLENFSEKVDIAGGYFWKNPHVFRRGCMGYVKHKLWENGIKSTAVSGCCFG